MFSPTIIAGLLLGLSQIPRIVAQPADDSSFLLNLKASDYFPEAKSDLSAFDVDVKYTGYNATTQSWLTGIDPSSEHLSNEEKAMLLTEAAYAKPFDVNNLDMTSDVDSLLAAVAGNVTATTALEKRSYYTLSGSNAVNGLPVAPSSPACLVRLVVLVLRLAVLPAVIVSHKVARVVASAGPTTLLKPAFSPRLGRHATATSRPLVRLQLHARVMVAILLRAVMSVLEIVLLDVARYGALRLGCN